MQSQKFVDSIVELGHSAHEFETAAEFKRETMNRLEHIFRSPTSVFIDWEHGSRKEQDWWPADFHFPHWDEGFRNLYYHRLRYEDPLFVWLESGRFIRQRSVTSLSSLVCPSEFKRTELYSELLLPLRCQYIMTLALNCGRDLVANVSLLRPPELGDFKEDEVRAAQLVVPMLSGAYKRLLLGDLLASSNNEGPVSGHKGPIASRENLQLTGPEERRLSSRELQIARLLVDVGNTRRVGEILCISQWTVKNHLRNVYAKLNINNRAALAKVLVSGQDH
ncbi:MAG: helix-turn-helix transcriptional regulator [Haliea sp.]